MRTSERLKRLALFFGVFIWSFFINAQVSKIDSLRKQLEISTDPLATLNTLVMLVDMNLYSRPDSSIYYAEKALRLNEKNDLGQKALVLNRMASGYWSKGELAKAMEYMAESHTLALNESDTALIARSLNGLGGIFGMAGADSTALFYFEKAYNLYKRISNNTRLVALGNNIGKIWMNLQNYDSAHKYLSMGLSLVDKDSEAFKPLLLFNKGDAYFQAGALDSAKKYFLLAESNAKLMQRQRPLIRSKQSLAELALLENDPKKALELSAFAAAEADKTNIREMEEVCFFTYAKALEANKKPSSALNWFKRSFAIKDSLQSSRLISQLLFKDIQQKELALEVSEKETLLANISAGRRLWGMILAIIFSMTTLGFSLVLFKQKRKLKDISERLVFTTNKFKDLYHHTPAMMCSLNEDCEIVSVNAYWLNHFGYREKSVVGKNLTEFFTAESKAYALGFGFPELFNTRACARLPYQMVKKNGEIVDVEMLVIFENDPVSQTMTGFAVFNDVTEINKSNRKAQKAYEMLDEAGQLASVGAWELNLERVDLFWSDMTKLIHEVPADYEPTLEKAIAFYAENDRAIVEKAIKDAIANKSGWNIENKLYTAKGKEIWVRSIGFPEFDENNKCKRIHGSFQDITHYKKIQLEIKESEQMFKAFANNLPGMVYLKYPAGKHYFANQSLLDFHSINLNEYVNTTASDLVGEDLGETLDAMDLEVFNNKTVINREYQDKIDGRWYKELKFPISDQLIGGFLMDITKRKQAETELSKSKQLLESVNQNVNDAIYRSTKDGLIYVNKAFVSMFGYESEEELISAGSSKLYANAEEREIAYTYFESASKQSTMELQFKKKDGTVFWGAINSHKFIGEDGEIFYDGILRDITQRKQTEIALKESEERYRLLIERAPMGIIIHSDDTIDYINPYGLRLLNARPGQDLTGLNVVDMVHKDDQARVKKRNKALYAGKKSQSDIYEEKIITQDGQEKVFRVDSVPIPFKQKTSVYTVFSDITALKKSHKKLEDTLTRLSKTQDELNQKQQLLLQAEQIANLGVWVLNVKNKKFSYWSGEMYRMYDKSVNQSFTLDDYFSFIYEKDQYNVIDCIKNSIKNKRPFELRFRVSSKYGIKNIKCSGQVDVDEHGNLKRIIGTEIDITQFESQKKEIEDRNRLLEHAENLAMLGSWEWELDENTLKWSEGVFEIYGLDKNIKPSNEIWLNNIVHPNDRTAVLKPFRECMFYKDKRSFQLTFRIIRRDDESLRYIKLYAEAVQSNKSGSGLRIVGTIQDVTESLKTQEKLKDQTTKLKALLNTNQQSFTLFDRQKNIVAFNDMASNISKELYGSYLSEGLNFERLITGHEKKDFNTCFQAGLKGETNCVERTYVDNKGKLRSFFIEYTPVKLEDDQAIYILSNAKDITLQKHAEQQVKQFEKFFSISPDLLCITDQEGVIRQLNNQWANLLGYSRSEIIGEQLTKYVHPSDQKKTVKAFSSLKEGQVLSEFLNRYVTRKGSYIYISWVAVVQDNMIFASARDVTQKVRIERALEASVLKYKNIYNYTPVMLLSLSPNGKIQSVSDYWVHKMEYNRYDVLGMNYREFITTNSKKLLTKEISKPVDYLKDFPLQFIAKNGTVYECLVSINMEYNETSKITQGLMVIVDISEQKRVEKELKYSQSQLIEAQQIASLTNYEMDLSTMTWSASEQFFKMFDAPRKPRYDQVEFWDMVYKPDLDIVKAEFDAMINENRNFDLIYRTNKTKADKEVWVHGKGRLIYNDQKEPLKFVGTIQDITQEKVAEMQKINAEKALVAEKEKISKIIHSVPGAVCRLKRDSNGKYELLFISEKIFELLEINRKEIPQIDILNKFKNSSKKRILKALEQSANNLSPLYVEGEFVDSKYKERVLLFQSIPEIIGPQEIYWNGLITDLTLEKHIERKLKQSLQDKEILLKEVHHRVKNNMQLISSILTIKSYSLTDSDAKIVFDQCNQKINSMAVVHEKLYQSGQINEVQLDTYISGLLGSLQNTYAAEKDVSLETYLDNITVNLDQALSLGLALTELYSNVIKHGLNNKNGSKVEVHLFKKDEQNILEVTSSGRVVPNDLLMHKHKGLGLSLLLTFARQLRGEVFVDQEKNGVGISF